MEFMRVLDDKVIGKHRWMKSSTGLGLFFSADTQTLRMLAVAEEMVSKYWLNNERSDIFSWNNGSTFRRL